MFVILRRVMRLFQICDVNCGPRSKVIVCGKLNRMIQCVQSASVHDGAVVLVSGAASAHRVVRSMIVRMCV
jgi:hypothetical protein